MNSTPEEIVAMVGNIGNRPDVKKAKKEQIEKIKQLVLAEREACASLTENYFKFDHNLNGLGDVLAKAIRRRSE